MRSNSTTLFISHDATRTGAPMALLIFLRWLRANSDVDFVVLLGRGGDLEDEFAALGPTTVVDRGPLRLLRPLGAGVQAELTQRLRSTIARRLRRAFSEVGLVYSNTLQNGWLLERLGQPDRPTIAHVHELEWWLRYSTDQRGLAYTKQVTDQYIVCSATTGDSLATTQGISRQAMTLCHEYVETSSQLVNRARAARDQTRAELGIPSDAFVVGGAGTMDWRKGPDLFVQLAAAVRRIDHDASVHFVWVGGEKEGVEFGSLRHDAIRADVNEIITWTGSVRDPLRLFAVFDVFAVTSREDPYPLVMLEAATLSLPVLCFDRGGGAPEFVGSECGHVSPYLDVVDMATTVLSLRVDPSRRGRLGTAAHKRVHERHTIETAGPRLLEVIERCRP